MHVCDIRGNMNSRKETAVRKRRVKGMLFLSRIIHYDIWWL